MGGPATGWLYPLTPEQERAYPGFRSEVKGCQDLENGIDSPEADELVSAGQFHELKD